MSWIVKRCYMDYDETWKHEVASYDTELEADNAAEQLRDAAIWSGDWYEVDEE